MTPNTTIWESCYNLSWQDLIVPDAFAHPAKMARGLLARILRHAATEGWLRPGAIILDPFGGIGSTGILGAYEGDCVVCCELEEKFVDLAKQNFALHAKKLEKLGCPQPVMIQGDSRELCKILSECDCIVSSPPFQESLQSGDTSSSFKAKYPDAQTGGDWGQDYGQTPGQLGGMKPGSVDAVVSSPPYMESEVAKGDAKQADIKDRKTRRENKNWDGYGQTPGNLGNLKPGDVEAIISSPPYEEQVIRKRDTGKEGFEQGTTQGKHAFDEYGQTEGQLGNSQGDTFWSAAKLIVQQCHQILKPGGVAIWVVKAFVRNKKIVDFPGDWRRLCESVGFEIICEHRAMLVKETRHKGLFGTITEKKERKSFFRRLAESKGSPPIDFENVLCMKRQGSTPF